MTFQEMFSQVQAHLADADVSNIQDHLAYQFHIIGDAEGVFYAEVKDGQLHVEPYSYDDRDVEFTCTADTLFKLAARKLDPILAVTMGKLKVEGDVPKALKLREILASR